MGEQSTAAMEARLAALKQNRAARAQRLKGGAKAVAAAADSAPAPSSTSDAGAAIATAEVVSARTPEVLDDIEGVVYHQGAPPT